MNTMIIIKKGDDDYLAQAAVRIQSSLRKKIFGLTNCVYLRAGRAKPKIIRSLSVPRFKTVFSLLGNQIYIYIS